MSGSSSSAELTARMRTMIDRLSPGDRLPGSRELIRRFKVGPATVARAIAALTAEGLVVTRPGSGTYVAARTRRRDDVAGTAWQSVTLADRTVDTRDLAGVVPEGTIRLDGGPPHPSLRPTRVLTAALARAARRPGAWDRAPADGLAALRGVFATMAGGGVGAGDILVTDGGRSALSMVFRAIAGPGDPVLMESPTGAGAIAAARAAGLRPVPVPTDADGLDPGLLADAFAMTRARLLHCRPTYHDPTGAVLAPGRRRQVLDTARAAGAFVIEDDLARLLGHGVPVPPPLLADDRDGTVVHLSSLTAPAAPSLRVGALAARGPVLARLRAARLVDDFLVARPLQEAALDLLDSPAWERHVRSLGAALLERCTTLAATVVDELPGWTLDRVPAGGLHLWARLPGGADDAVVADAARHAGVAVGAGSRHFPTEVPAAFLRLGFAAAADHAELAEAVRRLAEVDRALRLSR
ncbi:PLP-dependent aminotransferase family protein [Nonomuraea sp. NPDC047529]|uniref:aminotransferase-like domain-containing protein n=1 Tax=Nonomuraea sp. NPDC047529 TaxID=3155623 RepID=UPI0033D2E0B0